MRNKTSYVATLAAVLVLGCDGEHAAEQSVTKPLISGVTDDSFRAAASCGDCTVVNRSTVILPLTGKTITEAKMWSDSTKSGRLIALDERAATVDAQTLVRAEGAAKIARQGKLRDDVYAMSLTTSSELLPVWIWVDYKEDPQPRGLLIANPALRASVEAKNLASLRAVTSKVTSWLDARGYATYDRGTSNPSITADVPISALADLGRLDGVAIVGIKRPGAARGHGNHWFYAVKGSDAQGIIGSAAGQSFCNGEAKQPHSYAYLSVPSGQVYTPAGSTDPHATWTTEFIGATTWTRMAPGSGTYVANWAGGSASNFDAWQWCFSQGIGALNRSYTFHGRDLGGLDQIDMAQDYYVLHWPYPIITISGGQCDDCGPDCFVDCSAQTNKTVEARSYNVLVVGGSDDNSTSSTSDDVIWPSSAFGNPQTTHGDFELPNVVAPAVE
ncbi:MAG TPA: hypothetical protein VIF57_28395, partial [Polyangia bacterium]